MRNQMEKKPLRFSVLGAVRRHQGFYNPYVSVFRRALVRSLTVMLGGVASHAHARTGVRNASVYENDLGSLRA
jgi:hypothetical protein